MVPENRPNLQESLKNLAQCYKCIILVADLNTLDCLMNDANYRATFGALEYLPGLNNKLQIREFFQNELKFK